MFFFHINSIFLHHNLLVALYMLWIAAYSVTMLPDRKERDEQRQQLQEAAEAVAAKEMDNGVRINPLLAAMHAAKRAET